MKRTALPDALVHYASLVREWAPRLDLVAPADLERFEQRHIDDCLRARQLLDQSPPGDCVDVGSGAGLPGIVLALADPGRRWTLLEPRTRRAAFLEQAVRSLELDCRVLRLRAEEAARRKDLGAHFALATARALARPEAAGRLLLPLLAPGGIAAIWFGARADVPGKAVEWGPGIATMTKPDETVHPKRK